MNRILTVLFSILMVVLVTSCASMSPNKKKLIGTWKAVKVEPYNMPGASAQAAAAAQSEQKAKPRIAPVPGDSSAPVSAAVEKTKFEEQLDRIIKTEERSTLTINADKTAVKELPGKTIHAKWKLKNKGTHLIVDLKETGKKMDIDILRINDTSAVVVTNLPIGGLKVTYKKDKKVEEPKK